MIRFQIVEREGVDLYRTLLQAMREGELRTLHAKNRGQKVVHARYPGWIRWSHARGVITCKVISPNKPGSEWQLFSAVLGRLAHRYSDSIAGIQVQFPATSSTWKRKRRRRRQ